MSPTFDIPALRERMIELLGDDQDAYPYELEQRFPHVLAKLVQLWGEPSLDTYIESLLLLDRPNRRGFPMEAVLEILQVSFIHTPLEMR